MANLKDTRVNDIVQKMLSVAKLLPINKWLEQSIKKPELKKKKKFELKKPHFKMIKPPKFKRVKLNTHKKFFYKNMEVDERFFKNMSNPGFDKTQFVILRPRKVKDLISGVEDK